MRVTQKFLDELGFRGGWTIETINKRTFYTIKDPSYCQIFWLEYWYTIGRQSFQQQDFITFLNDGNLQHQVILDPVNGDLLMGPESWNLIYYLGNVGEISTPPIIFFSSPFLVMAMYVIISIVLLVVYYSLASKYTRLF